MTGYLWLDWVIFGAGVIAFAWAWGAIWRQTIKDKRAAEKEYNRVAAALKEYDDRFLRKE